MGRRQAAKRAGKANATNADLTAGAAVELRIERLVPGGAGIAHARGATFFVPLVAPGERVTARVRRLQKRAAFASLVRVIEPSAERIAPACKFFGRCGGCDLQQLSYEAQLTAKKEIVRDCLRRIARLEQLPDFEIIPSPQVWNYRTRARWQLDAARKILGYYELASRRILDIDVCPVLTASAQEQLNELRAKIKRGELTAEIDEIQVAVSDGGKSLALRRREEVLTAKDELTQRVGDELYHFNAAAFFQTNHALLPALVAEALGSARGERALDLYCGVGLFTVPLARRFNRVIGVESSSVAANFARRNLKAANLANAAIVNARVGAWLNEEFQIEESERAAADERRLKHRACTQETENIHQMPIVSRGFDDEELIGKAQIPQTEDRLTKPRCDFVLLDPPRTGAEPETVKGLLRLRAPRIVYVSCDPATLARDLCVLAQAYAIDAIKAFDMFPQTHHVETVVHLARRRNG